jgi:hypothetical protein
MTEPITVVLEPEDMERLDRWRAEVEPVDDRETAAANLIYIALDDVEGKNNHAGAEVSDTLALGVSMAMKLAADAHRDGLNEVQKAALRIQEIFTDISVHLNVNFGELAGSVLERLDAADEAPNERN